MMSKGRPLAIVPIAEIQGLHDSGLSTDDPEIPFGWRTTEADDLSLLFPGKIL